MKQFCQFLLFTLLVANLKAQSDEINISAAFTNFIDLRVVGGASIQFNFTTISHYQNGIVNNSGSTIEIASSTNFDVIASFTPFVNADGDEIDQRNLTYLIHVDPARASEKGSKWDFGTPQQNIRVAGTTNGRLHSAGFYAEQADVKILEAGPEGNAGSYEENQFGIWWRLGYVSHTSNIGLPPLLDQNIAPGTYTTTMTLMAMPVIL